MTVHQTHPASPFIRTASSARYNPVRTAQKRAGAVLAALTLVGVTVWLNPAAATLSAVRSFGGWVAELEAAEWYLGLMIPIVFAMVFAIWEQAHERENKVHFDVR